MPTSEINTARDANARPAVGVVMSAYNAEQTIESAVRSVLAQTWRNLELVVCDDCSTDGTRTVLSTIHDTRLRVLTNDVNQGAGPSRDRAIAATTASWIAITDADDEWHPQRLAALMVARGGDPDVVVFDDLLICHDTETGMQPWRTLRGPTAFGACDGQAVDVAPADWVDSYYFLMKPLLSVDKLKELGIYHSRRKCGEDNEFQLRLVAAGMKLRYVPVPYYHYRLTANSLSDTATRAQQIRDMLEDVLPLFSDKPEIYRSLQQRIDYKSFTSAIKSSDYSIAWRYALSKPSLLQEFITRGIREVVYLLHRKLRKATGRR